MAMSDFQPIDHCYEEVTRMLAADLNGSHLDKVVQFCTEVPGSRVYTAVIGVVEEISHTTEMVAVCISSHLEETEGSGRERYRLTPYTRFHVLKRKEQ